MTLTLKTLHPWKGQAMRSFLQRISSRKFLTALTVEAAALVVLFCPQHESAIAAAAVRIAALATMLLAALGYGKVEAQVDSRTAESSVPESPQ